MDWPGVEYVERARRQAKHFAWAHGRYADAEDFAQEATIALYRNWPRLAPTPDARLFAAAVRNWLVDYYRREFGKRGERRLSTVPYDALYDGWEPAADDDPEWEACRRVSELERIVDAVMAAQPARRYVSMDRRRRVLLWHAEGRTGRWMAGQLGISEFAISQLLRTTLETAREDEKVRALA